MPDAPWYKQPHFQKTANHREFEHVTGTLSKHFGNSRVTGNPTHHWAHFDSVSRTHTSEQVSSAMHKAGFQEHLGHGNKTYTHPAHPSTAVQHFVHHNKLAVVTVRKGRLGEAMETPERFPLKTRADHIRAAKQNLRLSDKHEAAGNTKMADAHYAGYVGHSEAAAGLPSRRVGHIKRPRGENMKHESTLSPANESEIHRATAKLILRATGNKIMARSVAVGKLHPRHALGALIRYKNISGVRGKEMALLQAAHALFQANKKRIGPKEYSDIDAYESTSIGEARRREADLPSIEGWDDASGRYGFTGTHHSYRAKHGQYIISSPSSMKGKAMVGYTPISRRNGRGEGLDLGTFNDMNSAVAGAQKHHQQTVAWPFESALHESFKELPPLEQWSVADRPGQATKYMGREHTHDAGHGTYHIAHIPNAPKLGVLVKYDSKTANRALTKGLEKVGWHQTLSGALQVAQKHHAKMSGVHESARYSEQPDYDNRLPQDSASRAGGRFVTDHALQKRLAQPSIQCTCACGMLLPPNPGQYPKVCPQCLTPIEVAVSMARAVAGQCDPYDGTPEPDDDSHNWIGGGMEEVPSDSFPA